MMNRRALSQSRVQYLIKLRRMSEFKELSYNKSMESQGQEFVESLVEHCLTSVLVI